MANTSPPPALARVQQSGVTIATAFENAATLSGVRQTETADSRTGGFTNRVQTTNMNKGAGLSKDLIPLPYRASSLGKVLGDRSNSPKIEVHTYGDDGTSSVPTFDDFILTDVSSQDAEKIDVCETFGVPHLFTSGRFVRRTTFQGIARTAPANYAASNNPQYSVSQSTMLRVFYDQYLRATQQADNGQYTSIIIDGHTYTGWVTTFNDQRDAGQEQWMPFTFTMIVTDRKSSDEADAMKNLARFANAKKLSRFLATQAKAELSDAVGSCEISWLRNGNAEQTLNLGDLTVKEGSDVKGAFSQKTQIRLNKGTPQRISVLSDTPGVVLVKADGTELHGTDLEVQTPVDVSMKVLDFAALWEVLKGRATQEGNSLTVNPKFTVTPTNGGAITATMGLTLDGVPSVSATAIKVVDAYNPGKSFLAGGNADPAHDYAYMTLEKSTAASVVQASNQISLLVTLSLTAGGAPLAPSVAGQVTAAPVTASAVPKDQPAAGALKDSNEAVLPGSLAIQGFVVDPATAKASFTTVLTLTSPSDLRTENPYQTAAAIELDFGVLLTVPGYASIPLDFEWLLSLTKPGAAVGLLHYTQRRVAVVEGASSRFAGRDSGLYSIGIPYDGLPTADIVARYNRLGCVMVSDLPSTIAAGPIKVPLTNEQVSREYRATHVVNPRGASLRVVRSYRATLVAVGREIRLVIGMATDQADGRALEKTLDFQLLFPDTV